MKTTTTEKNNDTSVATRIAGEDIAAGDFLTILSEVIELPSFLWNCSDVSLPPHTPVKIRFLPNSAGLPCKVMTVCLPFVYAKYPNGYLMAFDIRLQDLVRLDRENAKAIWQEMRKPFQKRTKAKRKKKKRG